MGNWKVLVDYCGVYIKEKWNSERMIEIHLKSCISSDVDKVCVWDFPGSINKALPVKCIDCLGAYITSSVYES